MKRLTLNGEVTLQDAQQSTNNMLLQFDLPERDQEFLRYLLNSRDVVATAVAQHMNTSYPPSCEILPSSEWIKGSFNVCIPVSVSDHKVPRVIIRFPLPHKIGELHFPGNMDEKLLTEAATYAYLDENCPEVPKPHLLGYALSDGRRYTWLGNMPLSVRLFESLRRRVLKWFGQSSPCRYVPHKTSALNTGYLLLEDVGKEGTTLLSDTWEKDRCDASKRQNLFRDLARIILSIGRVPMPRIGSFKMNDRGYLRLDNRPLTMALHQLENEGINTGIERTDTYSSSLDYGTDLVAFHDQYLRFQPNSIVSAKDGRLSMSAFACMRTILPHFFPKPTRNGPFIYQLTDIHQSNLFVDKDWHIANVIDLEFAAALPPEMELTPYWLTGECLEEIKESEAFNTVHEEFNTIFREECHRLELPLSRADMMQQAWQTMGFFFQYSLNLKNGCILMLEQVLPRFKPGFEFNSTFNDHLAPLWATDGEEVLARKLADNEQYGQQIQKMFAD